MLKYRTYSDFENVKLKNGQVFFCNDLRKKELGEPFQFTAWSEEQLHRLYEDGKIDDVNFEIGIRKSGEMGYSYNSDTARQSGESITNLKGKGIL